jgi:uncharacterized protein (TIGR02147 family)
MRTVAKRIECAVSLLSAVINKKRDLADHLAEKLATEVTSDEKERAYFLDMVTSGQAGTIQRRREARDRIHAVRGYRAARPIDDAMDLLFSKWYHPIIAELARCTGFQEDPAWIARTLLPPITPEEAAEALEVLLYAGFLVRGEDGRLTPPAPNFTTEHQLAPARGVTLAAMHRWMLARAIGALDLFPREERHFSTMSIALPAERVGEFKSFIERFEEELMGRFGTGAEAERVYQLSLQLFPLTEPARS